MKCSYCQIRKAQRSLGGVPLCTKCALNDEVRKLIPPYTPSQCGRKGVDSLVGMTDHPSAEPDAPIEYMPGSDEKMSAMSERALKGQALFHPNDKGMEDGIVTAGTGRCGIRTSPRPRDSRGHPL